MNGNQIHSHNILDDNKKNSTLSTFSVSPLNIHKPLGTLLQSIQKPKIKRKEGCFGGLRCAVSAKETKNPFSFYRGQGCCR